MPEQPTTVQDELAAMRKIAAALDSLDDPARRRTVDWMYDRYAATTDEPDRPEV